MNNICYSGIRFRNTKAPAAATLANMIVSWGALCRLAGALFAGLALALGIACAVASTDDLAFRILAFFVIGGIPAGAAYAAGCAACGALEGTGALCDYAKPLFDRTAFVAAGVPRRAFFAAANLARDTRKAWRPRASLALLRSAYGYAAPFVQQLLRALRLRSRPMIKQLQALLAIGLAHCRRLARRTGPKVRSKIIFFATAPIRLFAKTLLWIIAIAGHASARVSGPRLRPSQHAPVGTGKRANVRGPILPRVGAAAPAGAALRRRAEQPGRAAQARRGVLREAASGRWR
jgi:hypothetical protein